MKINLFTKVIFVIAASLLFCCKNLPKHLLVKKWKAVDVRQKDSLGKIKHSDNKKLITNRNTVFEFKPNGTYSISAHRHKTQNGKYIISEDGRTIVITSAAGDPLARTFIIEALTKEKLILEISPLSTLIMGAHK